MSFHFSSDIDEELLLSAYHGDYDAMCKAIDNGADINHKDLSGYTPLHWVSFMGLNGDERSKMARILIESGANVNSHLPDGGPSILSTACQAGNFEIVKVLVENGANVNDDHDGETPLINAVHGGDIEIVQYLLANGAEVEKPAVDGELAYDVAVKIERFDLAALLANSEKGPAPLKK